jgi:hypothetical protein
MADLLLHEERVEAVLDEMGDIGMPQAMRVEMVGQAELVAVVDEASTDVVNGDAPSPFGRPQRRAPRVEGPDLT